MDGSQEKPVKTTMEQGFLATQIGLSGVWLLALYPALLWVVLGTLSSYGFQDKVAAAAKKHDNSLTIQMVLRDGEKLDAIERREIILKQQLKNLQGELKQQNNILLDINEKKLAWQVEWIGFRDAILPKLVQMDSVKKKDITPYKTLANIGQGIEDHAEEPALFEFIPRYKKLLDKRGDAEIEEIRARNQIDFIRNKIDEITFELDNVRAEASVISEKEKIRDFISELKYMEIFKLKVFATMPSQLLTLMLTLSMGALGSLILITLDYLESGLARRFSWYLFRPFLGMVTAFAVFILAKAGQLTISDAGAAQSISENLNPYFISFMGIISGLLSEQATERIRKTGQVMLRTEEPDEIKRYAVGLEDALDEQKKSIEDLANYVNVKKTRLHQWVEATQPVPSDIQPVIAAWLGVPARKIFTDMGPDKADNKKSEDG